MSAWITDRLPTREDGDLNVNGWVYETRANGTVAYEHWSNVNPGTPWQPITYPEPYVKPKRWSWGSIGNEYAIKKNGKSIWVYYETHHLGPKHFDAMTDALNRLEEGV